MGSEMCIRDRITTYSLFAQICQSHGEGYEGHEGHEGNLCKEESGKTFGKGFNQKTFGKGNQADEINSETQQLEKVGPADFS